jgi:hypothetical protein
VNAAELFAALMSADGVPEVSRLAAKHLRPGRPVQWVEIGHMLTPPQRAHLSSLPERCTLPDLARALIPPHRPCRGAPMNSKVPDTHLSISPQEITPATPEQLRAAGLLTARYALNHDVDRAGLAELLQMLGSIPTVSGARTDRLGRRKT